MDGWTDSRSRKPTAGTTMRSPPQHNNFLSSARLVAKLLAPPNTCDTIAELIQTPVERENIAALHCPRAWLARPRRAASALVKSTVRKKRCLLEVVVVKKMHERQPLNNAGLQGVSMVGSKLLKLTA